MINQLLVNLVNSVLGAGKPTARGNYAYSCPICNHRKPKLEINFDESSPNYQHYSCWTCGGDTKGKKLYNLFRKIKAPKAKMDELKPFTKGGFKETTTTQEAKLELPEEFKSLSNGSGFTYQHALHYVKSRGITPEDIIKYNLGYCEYGRYKNMIILPSYDADGNLNYFTGRSFEKDPYIKYKNPEHSRDVIGLDLLINWEVPIVLCEGIFDAISIKRNAVPLLGKNIQSSLMKKLINSSVKKIYIALDKDAMKQSLKYCETLMNEGKKIYLLDMQDKDPSEMGFHNFTKLIQKTKSFSFEDLFEKKLELI